MNLFQSINASFTMAIIAAIVASIARKTDVTDQDPFEFFQAHHDVALLALFIVLLKVKTFFDDHKHFAEPFQDQLAGRYAGFVLAILSWIFWALAGWGIVNPGRSSELMMASILISTLWVGVHLIEITIDRTRRSNETVISLLREKWVLLNIGYALCLGGFHGWFRPVVSPGSLKALYVLLVLLLLDMVSSRSFKDILAKPVESIP